jgi:hypothetical protein
MKHERLATEESNQPLTSQRSNAVGNSEIRRHLAEQQLAEIRLSEKITPPKAVMFICYYFCLIQSVLLMVNIPETYYNNLSLYTSLTNSQNTDKGYEKIDRDKVAFHEITYLGDLVDWYTGCLLSTLYNKELGFQSFGFVPDDNDFLYFQTISPLRFTVNRAKHTNNTINNEIYKSRWDEDTGVEKNSYGKNGWVFNYSEVEGKFLR